MEVIEEIEYEGLPPNAGLGVRGSRSMAQAGLMDSSLTGQHDGGRISEYLRDCQGEPPFSVLQISTMDRVLNVCALGWHHRTCSHVPGRQY